TTAEGGGKGGTRTVVETKDAYSAIADRDKMSQEALSHLVELSAKFAENYQAYQQAQTQGIDTVRQRSEQLSNPEVMLNAELAGKSGIASDFYEAVNKVVAAMIRVGDVDPDSISSYLKALEDSLTINRKL